MKLMRQLQSTPQYHRAWGYMLIGILVAVLIFVGRTSGLHYYLTVPFYAAYLDYRTGTIHYTWIGFEYEIDELPSDFREFIEQNSIEMSKEQAWAKYRTVFRLDKRFPDWGFIPLRWEQERLAGLAELSHLCPELAKVNLQLYQAHKVLGKNIQQDQLDMVECSRMLHVLKKDKEFFNQELIALVLELDEEWAVPCAVKLEKK